jgi:hypothetical protein
LRSAFRASVRGPRDDHVNFGEFDVILVGDHVWFPESGVITAPHWGDHAVLPKEGVITVCGVGRALRYR